MSTFRAEVGITISSFGPHTHTAKGAASLSLFLSGNTEATSDPTLITSTNTGDHPIRTRSIEKSSTDRTLSWVIKTSLLSALLFRADLQPMTRLNLRPNPNLIEREYFMPHFPSSDKKHHFNIRRLHITLEMVG